MSWATVTKQAPCVACGKPDWCTRNETAIHCMRTSEPPAGWHMLKRTGEGRIFAEDGSSTKAITRTRPKAAPDLTAEAKRCVEALTPELASELADDLGVPVDVLPEVRVGWCASRSAWTFPERDANGRIIGISYRSRDGRKKSGYGHKRGLTIPCHLADRPDPVVVLEGASDVLAAEAMGYAAVGRPGNRSGVAHLAELLADREVLIVGENDEKPNGDWPGKDGAQAVATGLARKWGRPVQWALPPVGHKDARSFYVDDETGADLLELLQAATETAEPGGTLAKLNRTDADRKLRGIFHLGRTVVQTHVELCHELADFMDGGGAEAMGNDNGPLPWSYVAAGLGVTIRRVRQLVDAGRAWRRVNNVHSADVGQLTESHLRPLAKIEPDRQAEALEAACRIAREDHEVEQAQRQAAGRRGTRLRLKATHVRRAVQAMLPPSDATPTTPAAVALCETGAGESAREAARVVAETWQAVTALPGAPRALIEALDMARQLARNWVDGAKA